MNIIQYIKSLNDTSTTDSSKRFYGGIIYVASTLSGLVYGFIHKDSYVILGIISSALLLLGATTLDNYINPNNK